MNLIEFMKHLHPFLFIMAISAAACTSNENNSQETTPKDSVEVIPVEAAFVERGDVAAYYSTTATLEAEAEAQVVAKTSGIIKEIRVEEGDMVMAGQPLLVIDDEQYQLEMARAEANVRRLENEYNRNKELLSRGVVSAEVYERSKFEYESQKATLNLARLNVEYSTVRAPISGVITERMVKTGNMLVNNQAVFQIINMDTLMAMLHLPEHEMQKIRTGQSVLLHVDAIPNEMFTGTVARISPVIDRATGTFRVVVYVRDELNRLKPGMFARVRVMYDVRSQTLVMPKMALMTDGGNTSVFVVNDSLVYKKSITIGYTNGTRVEILNGLDLGARVVTVGQNSLRDSTRVEMVNLPAGS